MGDSPYKYSNFACIDPVAVYMDKPWYPYKETCPCDPQLSNPTGRGFTPCPFGVDFEIQNISQANLPKPLMTVVGNIDKNGTYRDISVPVYGVNNEDRPLSGSMFPSKQFSAPQAEPRPLVRIGQSWRSAWA